MRYKQNKGFTLIEILIVIAILGVLGFILTDILTQVLKGQNKINIVSHVKQNGQLVLDKLSNEIRSAEKIICVNQTSPNDSIVLFRNGNYTRIKFVQPTVAPAALANGYFKREDFTKDDFVDMTDQNMCSRDIDYVTPINLTDRDTANGISINYDNARPIFEKQFQSGFPDIILIRFRAKESVNAGKTSESTVAEEGVLFTIAASVRGGK